MIRQKLANNGVPQDRLEADTERRFDAVMGLQVPSDAELRAMQQRGELTSDEELARE